MNPTEPSASDSTNTKSLEALRRANFGGGIPVRLVLAETSRSSSTVPLPRHVLVSRQTYLHVGLESAVRGLHRYAPPTLLQQHHGEAGARVVVVQEDDDDDNDNDENNEQPPKSESLRGESKESSGAAAGSSSETSHAGDSSGETNSRDPKAKGNDGGSSPNNNKNPDEIKDEGSSSSSSGEEEEASTSSNETLPPYPVCWFEDAVTHQPLRWQIFAGVLFDSLHHAAAGEPRDESPPQGLPWEIRLHFSRYPTDRLLELDGGGVLETVRHSFCNSLKQGLVVRYGNNKEALNLSKQTHEALWRGISSSSGSVGYDCLAPVVFRDDEFDDEAPVATNDTEEEEEDTAAAAATTTNDTAVEAAATEPPGNDHGGEETTSHEAPPPANDPVPHPRKNNLASVPVRLLLGPTKPFLQKRCEGGSAAAGATLGSLLAAWAPGHFGAGAAAAVVPQTAGTTWRVAGLSPPLSTPLLDLWRALKHPDNFLYVSVAVAES